MNQQLARGGRSMITRKLRSTEGSQSEAALSNGRIGEVASARRKNDDSDKSWRLLEVRAAAVDRRFSRNEQSVEREATSKLKGSKFEAIGLYD